MFEVLSDVEFLRVTGFLVLLHCLWQGLAVACAAASAITLLRRCSPQLRYSVLLCLLATLAVAPIATLSVVARRSPSMGSLVELPEADTSAEHIILKWDNGPETLVTAELNSQSTGEATGSEAGGQRIESSTGITPLTVPQRQGELTLAETVERTALSVARPALPFVMNCYIAGVLVFLLRLGLGIEGGRRLAKSATPVADESLRDAISRCAERLRLRSKPLVRQCETVLVPAIVGVIQPVVLLPSAITVQLTIEQIEAILLHEFTHIRRLDHVLNLLQRMVEAFLFFHPAVWWLSSRIRLERELCCDSVVITNGHHPVTYAELLIDTATRTCPTAGRFSIAALFAVRSTSELTHRVKWLLTGSTEHMRLPSRRGTVSGFVLALLVGWGLSVSQSNPQQDYSETLSKPAFLAFADAVSGNAPPRFTYFSPSGIPGDYAPLFETGSKWQRPPEPLLSARILGSHKKFNYPAKSCLWVKQNPERQQPYTQKAESYPMFTRHGVKVQIRASGTGDSRWEFMQRAIVEPQVLPEIVDIQHAFSSGPCELVFRVTERSRFPVRLPDGSEIVRIRRATNDDISPGSSLEPGCFLMERRWVERPLREFIVMIEPVLTFPIPGIQKSGTLISTLAGDSPLLTGYWVCPFERISYLKVSVSPLRKVWFRNVATRPRTEPTNYYVAWPVGDTIDQPIIEVVKSADGQPTSRVRVRYPKDSSWSHYHDGSPERPLRWSSFLRVNKRLISVESALPFSEQVNEYDLLDLDDDKFGWVNGDYTVSFVTQDFDVRDTLQPGQIFHVDYLESQPISVSVTRPDIHQVFASSKVEWGEPDGQFQLRAFLNNGGVMSPGLAMKLTMQLRNVSNHSISWSDLPSQFKWQFDEHDFIYDRMMLMPWEGATGQLEPGETIEWIERLDILACVRAEHLHRRGDRLRFCVEFARSSSNILSSNPVNLWFTETPAIDVASVPDAWNSNMQFDWRQSRQPRPGWMATDWLKLRVTGDGLSTVVIHRIENLPEEWADVTAGRYELQLSPTDLLTICHQLQAANVSEIRRSNQPVADSDEIAFAISTNDGKRALRNRLMTTQASDQESIQKLKSHMQRLMRRIIQHGDRQ